MSGIKPISCVVASDLSARSDRALVRAFRIAGRSGGRVMVLHVVEEAYPSRIFRALGAEAESELRRQIAAMPESKGVYWKISVERGHDFERIGEFARTHAADLLILGGRRKPKLADLAFSSTAQRVVRRSSLPVLVVKKPYKGPYGIAIAAVDASDHSRRAVAFALSTFPELLVTAFHAVDIPMPLNSPSQAPLRPASAPAIPNLEHIEGFAERGQFVAYQGDAVAVLDELVRQKRPDLLICGQSKSPRSFFLGEDLPGHAMTAIDHDLLVMP